MKATTLVDVDVDVDVGGYGELTGSSRAGRLERG